MSDFNKNIIVFIRLFNYIYVAIKTVLFSNFKNTWIFLEEVVVLG